MQRLATTFILLAAVLLVSACGDRNIGLGDGGADAAASGDGNAPDLSVTDGQPAGDTKPSGDATVDSVAVDNQSCSTPRRLTLAAGKVSVSGDTSGAGNQFGTDISCDTFTSFDGAQRYYIVGLEGGKHYRLQLAPDAAFDGALYAFPAATGCSAKAIDAACAGYASDAEGDGAGELVLIAPIVDQEWVIVVDSFKAGVEGAFKLSVERFDPPTNDSCKAPQTLTLTGGSASVSSTTSFSKNEFDKGVSCGTSYDFDGAQLYYKVALQAGKHYEVRVTSTAFDTALYAFEASTPCNAAAVNLRCSGAVSDETKGDPDVITLSPQANGDYIIVVDSDWDDGAGAFSLSVKEIKLPGNIKCSAPAKLQLSQGAAQVTGDTSKARDEFAGAIKCGSSLDLDGPQLYYKVALSAGKAYRVSLTPNGFDAALYAFPAQTGCSASAINSACAAHYSDGAGSTKVESLLIVPAQSGDYVLAVDSYKPSVSGTFTLDVVETVVPSNTKCAAAQPVTLNNGQASVQSDTSLSSNEFGRAIDCAGSYDYDGPQLYYRVRLEAAKTYSIGLTPSAFDGSLYAFPASSGCSSAAINAACAAHYAENAGSGRSEMLTITPQSTGDWIIVADSWLDGEGGPISLAILASP